jgi:hypothetical protein
MIFERVVCSAQNQASIYVKISTISKRTEMRFHMTQVTLVFYRVCPKRFLRLWYIQRKPCTYLALRIALSPNEPKRASTWASSPRSTIRCVQNDFWGYGMFGKNRALILTLSLNGPKWDFTWPTSPRYSIGCVQNDFWAYGKFSANPCTYLASRLAPSPNGPKRASTWASSHRSTIWCIQNDFWAYGTFGANRAPILHRY